MDIKIVLDEGESPCQRTLPPEKFAQWMHLLRTTKLRKIKRNIYVANLQGEIVSCCAYGAQYLAPELIVNNFYVSQPLPPCTVNDIHICSIPDLNDLTDLTLPEIADVIEILTTADSCIPQSPTPSAPQSSTRSVARSILPSRPVA